MIKISNICLYQNSIFIKFLKILKIHEIFCENPRIIFVMFYDVHKENMFTINLEDGREAPSKASYCIFSHFSELFLAMLLSPILFEYFILNIPSVFTTSCPLVHSSYPSYIFPLFLQINPSFPFFI